MITVDDPNQRVFSTLDARFLLQGQGQITKEGVEFGGRASRWEPRSNWMTTSSGSPAR
ncbi:hypothetical protein [Cyanobium sp. ATX-6F1]|uniref:hypothetical protein n=1 Tax=Cyanobium sp. ATX-6F1 TaxID=3137388 RepID=UPI0039BE62A1